jgi:hypothetical protein
MVTTMIDLCSITFVFSCLEREAEWVEAFHASINELRDSELHTVRNRGKLSPF